MLVAPTLGNHATGFHIFVHPHVAADDGVSANGDASQNGRIGVDDDIILDNRVARNTFYRFPVLVERKTFGTECYTLIDFDMVADDGRFAYHCAGAVVDGEIFADSGAGWMSMPVSLCAISVIMRGISGTSSNNNSCAMR